MRLSSGLSDGETILDHLGRPNRMTRVLMKWKQEDQSQRDGRMEAEVREEKRCYAVGFEDGGRKEPALRAP